MIADPRTYTCDHCGGTERGDWYEVAGDEGWWESHCPTCDVEAVCEEQGGHTLPLPVWEARERGDLGDCWTCGREVCEEHSSPVQTCRVVYPDAQGRPRTCHTTLRDVLGGSNPWRARWCYQHGMTHGEPRRVCVSCVNEELQAAAREDARAQ